MIVINNNNISIGAVILAAGLSSRMNSAKPFLAFDDKRLFIDKILGEYLGFKCNKIRVIINPKNDWHTIKKNYADNNVIVFIENNRQEYERFYSVKLGLSALPNVDFCFIQNVDNPFVDSDILKKLFDSKSETAYCVPVFQNKGGHPILINREIIRKLIQKENNSNLKAELKQFDRINIPFDSDKILININKQEDYNIINKLNYD